MGLRAFLDIKLNEFFPEVFPLRNSWDALGEMLDNMEMARRKLESEGNALSDAQAMEFAFAAFLCGSSETSLKFLERITNETHLLKIVPLLLNEYSNLDFAIASNAPALRRLAVKLGGLKLLCLLVKCTPREFYANNACAGDACASDAAFPEKLWQAAADLNLLDAAPQPFLMGKMLMEMGMKPGKEMGELIKQSFELQLDGKITSTEEAIAWAKARF